MPMTRRLLLLLTLITLLLPGAPAWAESSVASGEMTTASLTPHALPHPDKPIKHNYRVDRVLVKKGARR
ncbi:MAG: hypothetical protein EA349_11365, partial [Halomonadaceae bacterium]